MASVPVSRVIDKLDRLLAEKNFAAAEEHLKYWTADAEACGDMRALLTIVNEQIGFYRKNGRETEALRCADKALRLAESMELSETVTMGTTLINAATAYKAFGHAEKALPLYERAREIYEAALKPDDRRLGGLYNNMALALCELGRYSESKACFEKALSVMENVRGGEAEMAISCCNMADLCVLQGENNVRGYIEKAFELLDTETLPRDSYYAFVCEKCAPSFSHYGYPYCEKELLRRARMIYEGT